MTATGERDFGDDPGERDFDDDTTPNQTTVTTVAPTPAGETPIYNNTSASYDPTPC